MSEPTPAPEVPAAEAPEQPAPEAEQPKTYDEAYVSKLREEAAKYRTKLREEEQARRASMTESERAVAEAREAGAAEVRSQYGTRLARTQWEAEAARRNPGYDAAGALEDLNLAKFIGEDGEPDAKAIAASVARLVPEASNGPTPTPSFDGGTRQPPQAAVGMTQLIRKAAGRA